VKSLRDHEAGRIQFDATPGLTDLKVVHIEESNTCDADDDSPKIAQVLCL